MGEVIQLRDHQSRADRERAQKALEEHLNREAIAIANEAFPSIFAPTVGLVDYDPRKHWPSNYRADEKDPA